MVELTALGVSPRESLTRGFLMSKICMTVEVNGHPAAMFGIAPEPIHNQIGMIWFLGTDRMRRIDRQFLRESEKWLDVLSLGYDALANCVHESNTVHIRWLRWLGFSFLGRRGSFIEFAKSVHV